METDRLPKGISVVIPVYNSAETLDELVQRLAAVLPGLGQDGDQERSYELILVNDSSPDRSWQEIRRLASRYPWIRAINLMRNYGQHNATLCGIRAVRYATIVTMDDDLQHPPEEIHKLLARLAEGDSEEQRVDVVYGLPKKMPHSWWRNLFSYLIKRFLALAMGVRTIRDFAAFRAFRTDLRRAFNTYQNPNVIIDVLLSWGTTRFAAVTVDEKPRAAGRSNYSFMKLFQYTMVVLTGFSTLPLRIASLVGFLFTIFGLLVLLYVVGVYIFAGSVPGFPFLASIVAVFSGVQLFALGIIGEYLARIFDRSMDRPAYIIEEVLNPSAEQAAGDISQTPAVQKSGDAR
jgi:undecaprenyl-phosphate 4-deoxy-4-formamido-L-arabinose transferase